MVRSYGEGFEGTGGVCMVICEDLLDLAHELGKFNVFIVDPPWSFNSKKTGGSMCSGAAQHYSTMTLEEIADIPMDRIAQRDAVMFCWVPVSLSYEIARSSILEKWNFHFKTKVFWEKEGKLGMGYWFRNQIEECWILTKGKPEAFRSSVRNVIHSKSRKHSEKPDELFDMVEHECDRRGMMDRLELFARGIPRPGWVCYGDEVEEDDE
jgi:N6-adenosine-specific RNA methylase IME4